MSAQPHPCDAELADAIQHAHQERHYTPKRTTATRLAEQRARQYQQENSDLIRQLRTLERAIARLEKQRERDAATYCILCGFPTTGKLCHAHSDLANAENPVQPSARPLRALSSKQ